MISDIAILDEITKEFENEGFYQNTSWALEDGTYSVVLEDKDGKKISISLDIEITDEDIEEIMDNVLDNIDISEIEEMIQEATKKAFEDEGYKQTNYWDYIYEDDVYVGTFLDINLNGIIVSLNGLTKEELKEFAKGNE